jgi:hypothetical protein
MRNAVKKKKKGRISAQVGLVRIQLKAANGKPMGMKQP